MAPALPVVVRARVAASLVTAVSIGLGAPGSADAQPAADADGWLDRLYADVAADLVAGKPLVVQVHVPLCDNDVLRCGRGRLGDGDDPDGNLYWATSGGFRGWFNRRGSSWTEVLRQRSTEPDRVELRVWRRWMAPSATLRARGVRRRFPVYVVAQAWRGESMQAAMAAYSADLFAGEGEVRRIELPGGEVLAAGGGARLVAFVGHNGWMDVGRFDWPESRADAPRRGTIAIACITEAYLVPAVPGPARVPLLFTRTLLFAGAHAFEGAVTAFAGGVDLATIRTAAARAYAAGQGKPVARVQSAFTNPSDRRWKQR
jgi:hypothetical protein